MMENAKMLIDEYVKLAEEILVEFSFDENSALKSFLTFEKSSGKSTVSGKRARSFLRRVPTTPLRQ